MTNYMVKSGFGTGSSQICFTISENPAPDRFPTRQLSYRKEDRAMRPIYGCPETFWESSLRSRLLFQKF